MNLLITFSIMVIVTILMLLINEYNRIFHFLVSSPVSSEKNHFLKEEFNFLRSIHRYFIFETILNVNIYMISSSACLLLVCRKATDVCKCILYTTTLPNSLIISRSFPVESWQSLMYNTTASDSLIYIFHVCITFISMS